MVWILPLESGNLTEYSCGSVGTAPVGFGIRLVLSSIKSSSGCKMVFLSCMNSPSTKLAMDVDVNSMTSGFLKREMETEALPNKKSPAKTDILLLKAMLPLGLLRRESELSITSSCSNEAVWIISTISARRLCFGKIPLL
ncbi:hypothetical protein WICPIJ_004448 [Wickerhamomyces pijperi]|uniref:Uncharacterized protein n=1 Tax=Wickerhamomyces pijperi TaxID=599730 RepID=A0A9P8TM07_WICPI|nr:hypothetical protein WICPIJ_004448 [Wickerhamomyces pijperi]